MIYFLLISAHFLTDPQFEGVTMEEWNEMVDRVELNDPGQLQMAGIVAAQFAGQDSDLASAKLGVNDGLVLDLESSSAGNSDKIYPRSEQEQLDYDREILLYSSAKKLLNFDGLRVLERPRYLVKRWTILSSAAEPLKDTQDNIQGWKSILLDPDEEGPSSLVKRLEKYAMHYMNSADLREEEAYPGFYSFENNMMLAHSGKHWEILNI